MMFKKFLSLSMLLAVVAGTFAVSEQSAEAGRCCRQRRNRCCGNGGYGYSGGYNTGYAGNCNTCTTAPMNNQGSAYGTPAPAPAPAPTTAPPPAPAT